MPWTIDDVDEHEKGLSNAQKRQWVKVANSVRARCLAKGGSEKKCDASAIRQANGVVSNSANYVQANYVQVNQYTVRHEMYQGKKHIVVPVVMMVEGVHNGSHGRLLHVVEEYGRHPTSWNGKPVTVDHPYRDGHPTTANSPDVMNSMVVGHVFNTVLEDKKLKGELWLDEHRLETISSDVHDIVQNARPLDVSMGAFTKNEMVEGEWNGEEYIGISRNPRPDHLALLLDTDGACSWDDGCGVRTNEEGGEGLDEEVIQALKDQNIRELAGIPPNLQIDKEGYVALLEKIQSKLNTMDDGSRIHYLKEVFDKSVVYEVRPIGISSGSPTTYRRKYKVEDGDVEFTGDPEPVVVKISYVTQEEGGETNMADKKQTPEERAKECPRCVELTEMLIQEESTRFDEKDKDWLITLSEDQLGKMVPREPEPEPKEDKLHRTKKVDPEPKPEVQATMSKEQAIQVLQQSGCFASTDETLKTLPPEISDILADGLQLREKTRGDLIAGILANSDIFTEEQLKAKKHAELEQLATLASPTDYSGQGSGGDTTKTRAKIKPLIPVTNETKAEEKK